MVRSVTDCAGLKNAETQLSTTKIAHISRTSVTNSNKRISTARTRSLVIMTRFTFQRSTKTPAGGPTIANGST